MGRKKGTSTARKKSDGIVALGVYPGLKPPTSAVGGALDVAGDFWDWAGHGATANRNKTYRCTVSKFHAMHKFGGSVSAAIELCVDGDDAPTFMKYPMPFLQHWYQSNPQQPEQQEQQPSTSESGSEYEAADKANEPHAAIYKHLNGPIQIEKVKSGKMKGEKKVFHKCIVEVADGELCNKDLSIVAGITSNAISHM